MRNFILVLIFLNGCASGTSYKKTKPYNFYNSCTDARTVQCEYLKISLKNCGCA